MALWLGTTKAVGARLGITPQRVRQLVTELGIEPIWVGKSMILEDADIRKLEKRKTQRGPTKRTKSQHLAHKKRDCHEQHGDSHEVNAALDARETEYGEERRQPN